MKFKIAHSLVLLIFINLAFLSSAKAGLLGVPIINKGSLPTSQPSNEADYVEYEDEADDESRTDDEVVGANEAVGGIAGGFSSENDYEAYLVLAKAKKKCGCSSGCGMIQKGLKSIIKKYVAAARGIGISPVSCIRTQACQDRLRACYNRCGMRGRAAKKSKHADGRACDFSKSAGKKLTNLKRKTGLPIKRLTHGREGGGLHEYQ